MSDCRMGGRFGHKWDEQVWRDPQITVRVHFTDGTVHEYPLARHGREVHHVTADGRDFRPEDFSLVEHYRDGCCYAVELDGVRYVRPRERDWDGEMGDR